MNTEEVKRWLLRYRAAMEHLEALRLELDQMEGTAYAPANTKLDGMPHSPNFEGDSIGRTVTRLDRIRARVEQVEQRAEVLYDELDNAIEHISGTQWPKLRAVLRWRYILLKDWNDVSENFYGDRADFLDKQDSYLRQTFRTHKKALEALSGILDE